MSQGWEQHVARRNNRLIQAERMGRKESIAGSPLRTPHEQAIQQITVIRMTGYASLTLLPSVLSCHVDDRITYTHHPFLPPHPFLLLSLFSDSPHTYTHVLLLSGVLGQMFYSFALKHPVRPAQDDVRNMDGFTPLTLACLLGRDQIFAEIVELKCFVS